MHSLSMAIVNP